MGLVSYTNIEDGQSADANVWNSRFGDILAQVNGNLDASNIRKGTLTRELFTSDALLAAWPVGSVHITVEDVNPGSLLGGNWVKFGQGKALMGVDENDSDFDEPEKSGGVKEVTLTVNQIPSHNHSVNPPSTTTSSAGNHSHNIGRVGTSGSGYGLVDGSFNTSSGTKNTSSAGSHTHTLNIPAFNSANRGGGQAHTNLSPYITVYFWKRVS